MKVNIVTYQKVFPLSPYVNEKIGIEIQVDEGESPEDAFIVAKQFVEDWHKVAHPELPPENGPTIPTGEVPVINRAEERVEMLIDQAATMQDLMNLKTHLSTPKLAKLFTQKLKKLLP